MTAAPEHARQGYKLFRERRIEEAVQQFRLGTMAGEDADAAALERWLSYMMAGEFEWAWQESDRVLQARRMNGSTCLHLPEHQRWLWDGTPLAGRNVLIRCFHGLGDTVQFVRFLPQLRAVCRSVSILPQEELDGLIPAAHSSDHSLDNDSPDLEVELMEVPHALRITLATLPRQVPYLHVPGENFRRDGAFHVGLAWASGAWRPERSVPLELFHFLDKIPGLVLTGLQRGPATLHLPPGSPLFHHADWQNTSVVETARTIRSLDLVITTDTLVAHLAGALGVPVWTLLHWDADWRWMSSREDSPWYPTMRLFRQQSPGDWPHVLRRVKRELARQGQKIRQNQAGANQNADDAQPP